MNWISYTELEAMKTAVTGVVGANCSEANLTHCGPMSPGAATRFFDSLMLVEMGSPTPGIPPAALAVFLSDEAEHSDDTISCSTEGSRCPIPPPPLTTNNTYTCVGVYCMSRDLNQS